MFEFVLGAQYCANFLTSLCARMNYAYFTAGEIKAQRYMSNLSNITQQASEPRSIDINLVVFSKEEEGARRRQRSWAKLKGGAGTVDEGAPPPLPCTEHCPLQGGSVA